ncbi:MAG: hypothetical protein CMP10_11345 [Zetaproteobacteria bacterium]|nr:hypothetical protein [Pseudobdellovibrionaceae bacterium]
MSLWLTAIRTFFKCVLPLTCFALIFLIPIEIVAALVGSSSPNEPLPMILSAVLQIPLTPILGVATICAFVDINNGKKITVSSVFKGAMKCFPVYWPLLKWYITFSLIVGLGMLCFIFPGFIFFRRWLFGDLLILLEGHTINSAMEKSKTMTPKQNITILPIYVLYLGLAFTQMLLSEINNGVNASFLQKVQLSIGLSIGYQLVGLFIMSLIINLYFQLSESQKAGTN